MKSKTQRNFSEEAFLHATFSEFVKCWGSGKRARIFVESMNGGAFVNFSTFLGNPGMVHNNQRKMAAKTYGHSEGHHDTQRKPHSGSAPTSFRKKSKRKTERDNNRAAEFQKKKAEEAEREASAASAKPSKKEVAPTANEEVAPTAEEGVAPTAAKEGFAPTAAKEGVAPTTMEAPDDDEKTSNENTGDEKTAQTSNGARVSVINVTDKTLADNIKSIRNVSKYSFHDTSDTESEALLNVDGNESLKNLDDPIQEVSNTPLLSFLNSLPEYWDKIKKENEKKIASDSIFANKS